VFENIKSGEFTFCSVCGKICHLGPKEFICKKCSFSHPIDRWGTLTEEDFLYASLECDISDIIKKYRQKLNVLRNEELK